MFLAKQTLTIIIPNWNGEKYLEKCLDSIASSRYETLEIIVVDNGSTNPIINLELKKCHYVKVINLQDNLGFSAAVNIGIKQAKGEYIAILNNDTELSPDWVENVISVFEKNSEAMFITSKIRSFANRDLLDDVGDVILPSGKVYKLGNSERDSGQYNELCLVFGASGCASVYRREFFEKVGFFDEDFFAYLEDIDLSFRASLLGYRCLYVPNAVVYHIGSATTGSRYNKFTVFHHAQNTINVIVKNYPLRLILRYLPHIVWYISSMQAYFLTKGLGWTFFKGIVSGIRMIKKMKIKRRDIMKNRVISDTDLVRIFKDNKKLYLGSKRNIVGG